VGRTRLPMLSHLPRRAQRKSGWRKVSYAQAARARARRGRRCSISVSGPIVRGDPVGQQRRSTRSTPSARLQAGLPRRRISPATEWVARDSTGCARSRALDSLARFTSRISRRLRERAGFLEVPIFDSLQADPPAPRWRSAQTLVAKIRSPSEIDRRAKGGVNTQRYVRLHKQAIRAYCGVYRRAPTGDGRFGCRGATPSAFFGQPTTQHDLGTQARFTHRSRQAHCRQASPPPVAKPARSLAYALYFKRARADSERSCHSRSEKPAAARFTADLASGLLPREPASRGAMSGCERYAACALVRAWVDRDQPARHHGAFSHRSRPGA